MKPSLILPLALALVSCEKPLESPQVMEQNSGVPLPGPVPVSHPSADLEQKVDVRISYSLDGQLKIQSAPGQEAGIGGSLSELSGFFGKQDEKSLIFVEIEKNKMTEAEIGPHVSRLNDYFSNHGYRRIVIRQGTGGFGPILSDITRPGSRHPSN